MIKVLFTADAIEDGQQTFRKSRRGNAAANRLVRFLHKHHDNVKINIIHI